MDFTPPRPPGPGVLLTRRQFTRQLADATLSVTAFSTLSTLAALSIGWGARPAGARDIGTAEGTPPASTSSLPPGLLDTGLLDDSPFVYISPLRGSGEESTCHAELWYAWLDEAVVVTVARDRWKASALARGLDRARIWVGDHGRWKTWYGGRNEAFRAAPHFDARVERVADPKLLDRLLDVYEVKYPDEVADWRDIMRQGSADGSRVLLRYTPIRDGSRA